MNLRRIGGSLLTMLVLLLIPVAAKADCSFSSGSSANVNFTVTSPVSIPFTLATGANLGNLAGPSAPNNAPSISCTNNVGYGITNLIGSIIPTGGTNYIYATNVAGVGYQLIRSGGGSITPGGPMVPYPNASSGSSFSNTPFNIGTSLQLVQTGPIANGSTLAAGTRLANWQWGSIVPDYFVLSNTVTFQGTACMIITSSIAVSMPTVSTTAFAGGATQTAGITPFTIEVNCPSGSTTSLSVNFSGKRISSTYSNVLKNNNTGTGAAKEVGVQILDSSSNPIAFNQNAPANVTNNLISVGSNISGAVTLPFQARYFATGVVTAGTVAATATFNVVYQ